MSDETTIKPDALAKLREPFPPNQISKLPKESRKQIDERKNRVAGCMVWECPECGNAHHKDAVHLDYVGHAAATDRLLDADPRWTWEPVADPASKGLPTFQGGMWITLTVDGVSRYGFGSADGKTGGDAIKEVIGDAIRNAGMRFGMALDLWHKGDLHLDDAPEEPSTITAEQAATISAALKANGRDEKAWLAHYRYDRMTAIPREHYEVALKAANKAKPQKREPAPIDDEIPY